MKQKLLERKYNEDNLNKQMEKVELIEGKELLQNNEKSNSKKNIPLVLTYNRTLSNISEVVRKNWHILQINPEFRNVFVNRGGSRTAATSKMERFEIIVNGLKPLTIITKRSILDVAAVLDPPLVNKPTIAFKRNKIPHR